ncbi:MAG: AraC family transcriptional regulator [Paludibacteraceae bacterium]|nr:AraC family transcriptional regulator [Paludibacteraceae bacterium]
MQVNFREIWYNYRSEVVFFIVLSAIVALSTYLSQFIPEAVFDNTITPILITATVATALIGVLLMLRRNNGIKARKLFGWALLVWGLSDLVYLIGWAAAPKQLMDMGATELTDYELLLGNLLGWVMLLYPTEALRPGWLTWKTALWQLLPMCALVGLDYIIPLNLSPVIALYPYVLLLLLFTHMRAYRIWCEENYSTLDDIDVRWIIRYCCMLILVGVNYVYMCYSHDHTRGFTQQWFVVFMMIYSIEQILFRKDPWEGIKVESGELRDERNNRSNECEIRSRLVESESVCQEEANSQEPIANSLQRKALEHWMRETKPYLNPDFQLIDLRAVLPMNRTYLSRFLRDEFGCTFYQFVNKYRIEEAKRLMTEQPDLKIEDVAIKSGFSSRSSFTQTFTKETGFSPREWNQKYHPA